MIRSRLLVRYRSGQAAAVAPSRDKQGDDQHEVRNGAVESGQIAQELGKDGRLVAGDHVLQYAERQPGRERYRDRPHAGDGNRGERCEHHEGEGVAVQLEQRGDQNTAEPGQGHGKHPRDPGRAPGIDAAQLGQRLPIHLGAHLEAHPGPADDHVEHDRRQGGDYEDRELV